MTTGLKSQIGVRVGPYREKMSAARFARFSKVVGSEATEHAPPTFLTVFRKGEFELFAQLGFELSQILHTEQDYEYSDALRPDDEALFWSSLTHVLEKVRGDMRFIFMTFVTEIEAERADKKMIAKIAKSTTSILVRLKAELA